MLALGEIYFRYFHADSEGVMASRNWIARYWHENAAGFRDRDWSAADFADKVTVAVAGDSFAAGWGIADPADRFSDVLAALLGDDYAVFNLGITGTSTPQQLEALREGMPVAPDVVILQYFLNDIEYATLSLGLPIPERNRPTLVNESYLADYLFSRFNSGFGENYWLTEYASYDNFAIWDVHQQELNAFIDYVERIDARLIVVIFPNMQDPVGSIAYVDRVAQVFAARGYDEILKLFDEVARWQRQDLIVSPLDAHPSVAFHHRVGELIYEQFFEGQ